jgi:hypothetical protein
MHLSETELESLVADLEDQYRDILREYAEADESELKAELTDVLASVEYRISRLEKERLELPEMKARQIEQILADLRVGERPESYRVEFLSSKSKASVSSRSGTWLCGSATHPQIRWVTCVASVG